LIEYETSLTTASMHSNTHSKVIIMNKTNKKTKSQKNKFPLLKNLPAYAGQKCDQFKVNTNATVLTTTTTSGQISVAFTIQAGNVPSFSSRFESLFDEYRIVKARATVQCFSSTNPGMFSHWFEEKNTAVPTAADAQRNNTKVFSASNSRPHMITWVPRDPLDLQYVASGAASPVLATYKIYTDGANFGSSIVATPYAQLRMEFWIQFRGLN